MPPLFDAKAELSIHRRSWKLHPDPKQVICRPNIPDGSPRQIENIIHRVLNLSIKQTNDILNTIVRDFSPRHRHLERTFSQNFDLIKGYIAKDIPLRLCQKKLLGAYFTMEYAVASAALFNPSLVPHPDQTNIAPGTLRFVMSLRAVGEGHISSIVFRTGIIGARCKVNFDKSNNYMETPIRKLNPYYDKHLFQLKLKEMYVSQQFTTQLFEHLPEQFSFNALQTQIDNFFKQNPIDSERQNESIRIINWLANSNYELNFDKGHAISERVIFPTSEVERGGIEDARFVRFYTPLGDSIYYATYTAYSGTSILPQLIETVDFEHFKITTLNGPVVQNKGMALFPRQINGQYAMLSRQDGENNFIMFSDHLHFWRETKRLQSPSEPWEFVQIGNCGSPLEVEQGWLVLTHGVGPMRQYSIGAMLLDLDDPTRIIAKLKYPLLSPHEEEREGYVPNVVYSCGGLIHHGELMIPYAMSDISSGLVSVNVKELLANMTHI